MKLWIKFKNKIYTKHLFRRFHYLQYFLYIKSNDNRLFNSNKRLFKKRVRLKEECE